MCLQLVPIDPPGPPKTPEITEACKAYIAFTWEAPDTDGGSPITGYYVERRATSSQRWVRITKEAVTELAYSDKEVMEDTEYEYRVMAENKVGVGPPSEPSKPATAKDPWGRCSAMSGFGSAWN